jgi:hypothetical protein
VDEIRRIVVYVHRRRPLKKSYVLSLILSEWRAQDIEIVVLDDPKRTVDADLAILHVDLTRRPEPFEALQSCYPVVLNAGVRDVSKRMVSHDLLARDSAWDGPVIVKTDANFFGVPESRLARRSRNSLRSLGVRLASRLPTYGNRIRRSHDYPVLEGLAQVPAGVWRDRSLVVERFLPETRDGFHLLRTWAFLGDREVAYLNFSREPIVKSYNTEHREPLREIPEPIRLARRRFGFDYGKFDFVIHEGRPVLLDVNPTPTMQGAWAERHREVGRKLADGIRSIRARRTEAEPLPAEPYGPAAGPGEEEPNARACTRPA